MGRSASSRPSHHRFRDGPAQTRERIKQRAAIDGKRVPIHLELEPGSSGKSEFDTTRREMGGYTVLPDRPTGPKAVRAGPAASAAQGGHVKLVRGEWVSAWLDEMEAFPLGSHDDQVDGWSGAFKKLSDIPLRPMQISFAKRPA